MSEGTFFDRKSSFGGMMVSEAKGPKSHKDEDAKLENLLVEQMLDLATTKGSVEKNGRAAVKHKAVAYLSGRSRPFGAPSLPEY